jgi:hypothetical protein
VITVDYEQRRARKNRPPLDEPFIWLTRSMIESWAWSAMSLASRLGVERVMIEHMNHAGRENGSLRVTYDQFHEFGVRRRSVAAAIRAAQALGFLDVAVPGVRAYGSARRPTQYGLPWLPRADGTDASNRWKSIKDKHQAQEAVRRAAEPPP